MCHPTYSPAIGKRVNLSHDPVRYGTIGLAIERVQADGIGGAFAEIGVWRGDLSEFIHSAAPDTRLYLFDTFQGFPAKDKDDRFKETSAEFVKGRVTFRPWNVTFRIGEFPATASGLEQERFSLVVYDADKYEPAIAALEFFYPRLSRGGYFFLHDFNNHESDWAVRRAMEAFMRDKPEMPVEIPDRWGTVLFRKH